jgi:large subunit ribosomal protein L31
VPGGLADMRRCACGPAPVKIKKSSVRFFRLRDGNGMRYVDHSVHGKALQMKKDIHPAYDDATITCACGNVIHTRSTKKTMNVNTCSACHPYFTGQQTMLDTEGRVDLFMKRYSIKKA